MGRSLQRMQDMTARDIMREYVTNATPNEWLYYYDFIAAWRKQASPLENYRYVRAIRLLHITTRARRGNTRRWCQRELVRIRFEYYNPTVVMFPGVRHDVT